MEFLNEWKNGINLFRCKRASGHNQPKERVSARLLSSFCLLFGSLCPLFFFSLNLIFSLFNQMEKREVKDELSLIDLFAFSFVRSSAAAAALNPPKIKNNQSNTTLPPPSALHASLINCSIRFTHLTISLLCIRLGSRRPQTLLFSSLSSLGRAEVERKKRVWWPGWLARSSLQSKTNKTSFY